MRDFLDEFVPSMVGTALIAMPIVYWFDEIKAWVQSFGL